MPGVILSQLEMQIRASCLVGVDHVFDGVGDQLAAGQGVEHAVAAHGDAVVDGDRVELDAVSTRGIDDSLDLLTNGMQVHVPGHELGEGVGDGDDGFGEILRLHAGGAPQGAGAGHAAALGGGGTAVGDGWAHVSSVSDGSGGGSGRR